MIITFAIGTTLAAILLASCLTEHFGGLPYTIERQSRRDRRLVALHRTFATQVSGIYSAHAAQRAARLTIDLPRPARIVSMLGSIHNAQQAAETDLAVARETANRNWLARLDRRDFDDFYAAV